MDEQREHPRRSARKKQKHPFCGLYRILEFTLCVCLLIVLLEGVREWTAPVAESDETEPVTELQTVATEPPTQPTQPPTEPDLSQVPANVLELMDRNPEAADFVRNYPNEYGKPHEVNMDRFQNSDGVPLFIQWDPMWGYLDYGGNVVGLSGCGPVCLAMAGAYVTGDYETFRPDRMVEFALEEGYRVPGNGTMWSLISEGGEKLGLDVRELPLVEGLMKEELEDGNPIICILGPGIFTEQGHYIVLTGYENGKFRLNDPNSPERSAKLWDYSEFEDQVRNLWVIRAK